MKRGFHDSFLSPHRSDPDLRRQSHDHGVGIQRARYLLETVVLVRKKQTIDVKTFAEFLGMRRLEQFATPSMMSILRAIQLVQRGCQKDLLLFLIEYIQMQGKIFTESAIRTQGC